MKNMLNVKFCDTVDDADTVSITFEGGNEWTVQLENGRFRSDLGCFTYLNNEHFLSDELAKSYKNNATELAQEAAAIVAAEEFYKTWSIKHD